MLCLYATSFCFPPKIAKTIQKISKILFFVGVIYFIAYLYVAKSFDFSVNSASIINKNIHLEFIAKNPSIFAVEIIDFKMEKDGKIYNEISNIFPILIKGEQIEQGTMIFKYRKFSKSIVKLKILGITQTFKSPVEM